jgi:hypothetical protein
VALDLSGNTDGSLVVKEGAMLTSTDAIKGNVTRRNVINDGTIVLSTAGKSAVDVVNNGTITSATTAAAEQLALVRLPGTGTISFSGESDNPLSSSTVELAQNVVIASGGTVQAPNVAEPFTGGKTIRVVTDGTLALGANPGTFSNVTIRNSGTVSTATASVTALNAVLGFVGTVTSTGAIAASTAAFTLPEDVTLTQSGAFGVTGAITINGTAIFVGATFADLVGTAGILIFTVGEAGNATLTAATFAAATVGDIVIDGTATLNAAAVPGGDVKVGGTLTLAATGSLTVAGGQNLLVKNGGSLNLYATASKVVLKGAPPAGAMLMLGNGAAGANTVIQAANADTAVTDATITVGDAALATITVAQATASGSDSNGSVVVAA